MNIFISWKNNFLFFLPYNLWKFIQHYCAALNRQKYLFLKIVGPLMVMDLAFRFYLKNTAPIGPVSMLHLVVPPTLGLFLVALALRLSCLEELKEEKEKIIAGVISFSVLIPLFFLFVIKIVKILDLGFRPNNFVLFVLYPMLIYYIFFFLNDQLTFWSPLRASINSILFYVYHLPVTLFFSFCLYRGLVFYLHAPSYVQQLIHMIFLNPSKIVIDHFIFIFSSLITYPLLLLLLNTYSVYFDQNVQR